MKDLSYLQAFPIKVLRSMRKVLKCGFTLEDIDTFLENPDAHQRPINALTGKMERPCCGEGKIDKELQGYKAKQRGLRRSK